MKSRGRLDAVTGVVGDAAGALRRRRVARRPYAKLYDSEGEGRLLDPDGEQAQALHQTAFAMVEAVAPGRGAPRTPEPRPGRPSSSAPRP